MAGQQSCSRPNPSHNVAAGRAIRSLFHALNAFTTTIVLWGVWTEVIKTEGIIDAARSSENSICTSTKDVCITNSYILYQHNSEAEHKSRISIAAGQGAHWKLLHEEETGDVYSNEDFAVESFPNAPPAVTSAKQKAYERTPYGFVRIATNGSATRANHPQTVSWKHELKNCRRCLYISMQLISCLNSQ